VVHYIPRKKVVMKKLKTLSILLTIFFLTLVYSKPSNAQVCQGDITLSTQAQVDGFACTQLIGNLTISGDDVTNLNGLSSLRRIQGQLLITNNANLITVDGLPALDSIGQGIEISGNPQLETIDGFSSLTILYNKLLISNNPQLTSFNGFNRVERIPSFFDSKVVIDNNASLPNIDGLASLRSLSGKETYIDVSNNGALLDIDGLSSLRALNGTVTGLSILNNPLLKNLNGLSSLRVFGMDLIGSIDIQNNATLENINGLSNIAAQFDANRSSRIIIKRNPLLSQCSGLYSLFVRMGWDVVTELINLGNLQVSENGSGCTTADILANGPQTLSMVDLNDIPTGSRLFAFYEDTVTVDLANRAFSNFEVLAHAFPAEVGSVEFILDKKYKHTENAVPYTFTFPFPLKPGTHTLTINVYSKPNRQGMKGVGRTLTFIVINSAAVERFEIVNTSGHVLDTLNEGDKLNILDPAFKSIRIRANTEPNQVAYVKFWLNGQFVRRENGFPYILSGDNNGIYYPWNPKPGDYTLLAIPYIKSGNKEYEGKSLTVNFKLVEEASFAVVGFDVVDTSGKLLQSLNDGDKININDPLLKAINIVANTTGQVGSVNFWVNNKSYRTENGVPYTLAGDQNGKFNSWSPRVGNYILSAIPHSQQNAKGLKGKSLTIHFTVVSENVSAVSQRLSNEENEEIGRAGESLSVFLYPVPVDDELHVKISDKVGSDAILTIRNSQGMTIDTRYYSTSPSINTLPLAPGIYFMQVVGNKGFQTVVKFIKE
jgi:hypothetical protein